MFSRAVSSFWKRSSVGTALVRTPKPVTVIEQQTRSIYIRFDIPPRRPGGGSKKYQRFDCRKKNLKELWENPNFRKFAIGTAAAGLGFVAYNTETVPITGRRRFNIVSPATEVKLAKQMYEEVMQQFRDRILPGSHPTSERVRKVLDRLIPVSGLDDLDWEIHVVKDDSIRNAFVIPGGKVFVFSGILHICGDEGGLAAVLSHEIAHTVAHHSAERFSKSLLVFAAIMLAGITLGDPDTVSRMGRILLDLVYLRPGSRRQEAEADYIGLMMMAQACYKPEKALELWERMDAEDQGAVPQFLSTHPSNVNRIKNIEEWLPEAKLKGEMSDCAGMAIYADDFMKVFEYPKWG